MRHGFYAVMGGFAFNYPGRIPENERFLPDGSDSEGIWFLHRTSVVGLVKLSNEISTPFDLLEEELKARSKASGLAKTLVCVQAVWYIAQCLTRRK